MNEQPISLETNYFGALGYHRQGSLCATPTTTFGYQGRQLNGMIFVYLCDLLLNWREGLQYGIF